MRLTVFAAALTLSTGVLTACAATPMTTVRPASSGGAAALVSRDGDSWTVDYDFGREAPAWAFMDSALIQGVRQPWRPRQWTVLTPGVVMERRGHYDVLRSADGRPVPRHIRIAMRPQSEDLEAEYGNLVFSDGAVAIPTRQFDVFALASPAAADVVPEDLNGVDIDFAPVAVTWRDRAGPVLFNGQRRTTLTTVEERGYVLLGAARVSESDGLTTVIDPNLPSWIGDEIRGFAPRVIDYYHRRLGDAGAGADQPTVMVSWDGPTEGKTSMGGSVLPGLIVLSFEGSGVLNPRQEMLERSRWFIGHEGAHFWLGQKIRYEFARDAWITEGGADLMAVRALKALNPAYDARAELQTEIDDCVALSRGRAVVDAGARGEHRAYYAGGAVFALAAEAAQKRRTGGDWFDFLRPLLNAQDDGVLTRAEWLAELTRVSGGPEAAAIVAGMLDRETADPAAQIARLFDRTGVAYRLETGRVILT